MKPKVFFTDIKKMILGEISIAKKSIDIAVPWFTDFELFNALLKVAQNDDIIIRVISLDDRINNESGLNYSVLSEINNSCSVSLINGGFIKTEPLMHSKFCIIDNKTTINGSYNWTSKANINHETVTLHKNDIEISKEFSTQFEFLLSLYFNIDKNKNIYDRELKQLWLYANNIKNIIISNEKTFLNEYMFKLGELKFNSNNELNLFTRDLINYCNDSNDYRILMTIGKINNFISDKSIEIYNLARAEYELKNYKKALEIYLSVIDLKPDLEIAWIDCAKISSIIEENLMLPLSFSQIASIINSSNFDAVQLEADILIELTTGGSANDIEYLESFIRQNPNNVKALLKYGSALISSNNYVKAEEVIHKALEIDKCNIYVYKLLGSLYFHKEDPEKSIEYLLKYISIIEDDHESLLMMGASYYFLDKYDESIKYLNKSNSLKSNVFNTLFLLAEVNFKFERYNQANIFIMEAIGLKKTSKEAIDLLNKISKRLK